MKIITHVFLLSSLLLLSSSLVFAADKDKSILDALSDEAKETSMDEGIAPEESVSEPSIAPKAVVNFSDLEEKIADQIKGLLVDKSKDTKEKVDKSSNFQNKLENVVSGALLKGHKLDDIRHAVSATMLDIKHNGEGDISKGTIDSATQALKGIVGEKKAIANSGKQNAYAQSLQAEPSDDVSVSSEKAEISSSGMTNLANVDTVTVLEGENLFKIAQRVYGSGENYLALYEANKDIVEDPNLIRIGQVLKIPR